ncbi:MAG: hypothetical protein QOH12_1832 [Solirubrobacteraceae bacterium]|nr:hypothetical protein [Solirubrobacteraceae bacterium]
MDVRTARVATLERRWAGVGTTALDRRPGQFAEERFKARRRAWLRRVWWAFPLAALVVVATTVGLALALTPKHPGLTIGFGVGAAVGMVMALIDSPPAHIERWRAGAEGEKRTARAVRRLLRDGWVLLNDLPRGPANIDHVLIGPPGVFLLESKHLSGAVSVSLDELHVRWLEDPDDGYVNRTIGPRARGAAAELSGQLRTTGGRHPWVQSVVVLWATFAEGTVEHRRVLWTRGDRLADTLAAQSPTLLSPRDITHIADQVRAATPRAGAETRRAPATSTDRRHLLGHPTWTRTRHLGN